MNPSSRFTDVLNSILFLLKGLGWGFFGSFGVFFLVLYLNTNPTFFRH